MKTDKFERITNVSLPYDRRHPDPSKNFGIGGLRVWFILKGPAGAVQFCAIFPCYLPHVQNELMTKYGTSPENHFMWHILAADVGYHSHAPMHEGAELHTNECEVLGGPCYYDGSSMEALAWGEKIFAVTGEKPEAVLWALLEKCYAETFESPAALTG